MIESVKHEIVLHEGRRIILSICDPCTRPLLNMWMLVIEIYLADFVHRYNSKCLCNQTSRIFPKVI
jgi:hypothetical protein